MAGPGYGGFFLKGLAGGIQKGVDLGMQIREMQWQKAQRKKLEEKEKKIEEEMTIFGSLLKQYGADNVYSDEEVMQLNTVLMASVAEVQAIYGDGLTNIQTINSRKLEEDFQLLDLLIAGIDGLNPKDVQGIFDTAESWFKTEKAKNYFTAYENIHKKRYEAAQAEPTAEVFTTAEEVQKAYPGQGYKYDSTAGGYVPTFQKTEAPKTPGITDYTGAVNHMKHWKDVSPEAFKRKLTTFQSQFPNIDMSAITQEMFKAPEEVPIEGEITSGEKRAWDMASSVLFGSSDFVTGISKPGIISLMISSKLNMGQTLTEEEKTEVRNNYNMIKGTLPNEIISVVEGQLQRYGIPLEAPVIAPEIVPPTPEPQPGILQRGIDKVKSVIGGGPDIKPIWGLEGQPTGEIPKEAPPIKVPTGAKEAMIPMMTKKELEEAIKGLDPSDPLYKLIYEEAVKRGYITK